MRFPSIPGAARPARARGGVLAICLAGLLTQTSGAARASDELYGWRGFYVGASGTYAIINQNVTFKVPTTVSGHAEPDGFGGTLLTGYRIPVWSERYRAGIEFDGTVGDNSATFNGYRFSSDFLVTLRGTFGVHVTPDLLWTGTAGVGWLGITSGPTTTALSSLGTGTVLTDRSSAKPVFGGVVGTALEWDMGRAIHLRGDYLYGEFGDTRAYTATPAGSPISDKTIGSLAHQLRIGVVVSLQNPYDEPHGRGGDIDHDRYVGGPMK